MSPLISFIFGSREEDEGDEGNFPRKLRGLREKFI